LRSGSPRPARPWPPGTRVGSDPVHWFTRDTRWDTRRDAAVGSGDLVSIEYWRVQVRLNSNSALRTFTLRRNPLSTQCLLESISD
jgi:hypothetical protein